MARLFQLVCLLLGAYGCLAVPTNMAGTGNARTSQQPRTQPITSVVAQREEPVTIQSYGHLLVNLAVGAAALLGTVITAEFGLKTFLNHKEHSAQHKQDDVLHKIDYDTGKELSEREDEAMRILLAMAERHAQSISSEDFDGEFEPYVVPRRIHKSLEGIFRTDKRKDGKSTLEAYKNLKETL